MPFPAIDPVAFAIGPVAIKWYGLAYVAGLLFAWWYARRLCAAPRLWTGAPLQPNEVDDLVFWCALGVILGGRLGYVLFYKPLHYLSHPLEALAVWQGGMSFHGGFLGVVLAMYLYARRKDVSVLPLFDLAGAVVPIGLFFGRIANFINAELWGRVTDVSWGVIFPGGGPLPRHPSQLYEAALEGAVLFGVIWWLTHSRLKFREMGFVAGAFAAGYGAARIVVEFFREPDAHLGYLLGPITMGMLLSLPMVLAGAALMIRAERKS
ncbi:MAG: prolipoprotein diacylglyceryl transferase [Pseudomonadota bacterium]